MSDMPWDVVVLTSSDDYQKEAFEKQLSDFLDTDISYGLELRQFRVYSDWPPDAKIGPGGGTLLALHKLYKEFQEQLFNLRILMLHAGGYSQRQPSASVLGKIFTPLPRQRKGPYSLLNLKLQLYSQFPNKMSPGVFLAAGDALEAFNLDADDSWGFTNNGFTVLCHPSPVKIAVNHGVYLLDGDQLTDNLGDVSMIPVKRVLQKPTIEKMQKTGAILAVPGSTDADQFVYTDSAYYFCATVLRCLINFYQTHQPLNCELDCYGDFLRPLGSEAVDDYFYDSNNTLTNEPDKKLAKNRKELYDLLQDFPVVAMVLPKSKFYHIGTMNELLKHLCSDPLFSTSFGLDYNGFCSAANCPKVEGCIMSSALAPLSIMPRNCIVEYCDFSAKIELTSDCILSNCMFDESFDLPFACFLSTIPIRVDSRLKYVTVIFGTNDDLKKKGQIDELTYCDRPLDQVLQRWGIEDDQILNLWTARLFPAQDTMIESFKTALAMLNSLKQEKAQKHIQLNDQFSMADILKIKDINEMLKFRRHLIGCIKAEKGTKTGN